TLENAGEAVAHFGGRLADRDGAGNVGGAILVLAAGVDQKQFTRRNHAIAPAGDAVMHDRAVGARAGDGWKGDVLEQPGVAAKAFERRHGVDLGELAARGLAIEPGKKARDGGAVADMRRARASDLDLVLHRLHQRDRTRSARDLAAVAGDEARERVRGGDLIEPHGLFLPAERSERADEIGRLAHVGEGLQTVANLVRELSSVDEERWPAGLRNDGEGERKRRMGDVRAANV